MPRKPADDAALIYDMLEYASKVDAMTSGLDFAAYSADEIRRLAVERAIEIIGEAARHVSNELKSRHAEVPWRIVEAQRHVLAHDYGEIVDEKIWRVARDHLPLLVTQLRAILAEFPPPKGHS